MEGLKDSVRDEGEGWVEWSIRDATGEVCLIRTRAYYIPEASIRLFSPQAYFKENPQTMAECVLNRHNLQFTTACGRSLFFPLNSNSNLPLMFLDWDVPTAGLTGFGLLNIQATNASE